LIIRDGRIEVVYDDPEWRDGLRFMNRLYEDGLIHQEAFVQQLDQLKALGENEVPILGSTPAGQTANGGRTTIPSSTSFRELSP
jgi:putative aldouronate transport system substrate-binding protein